MSLLDELAAATRPAGSRCAISILYDQLDENTAMELRLALADSSIPGTVIADVLSKRGHRVGKYSVQRHRRLGTGGGCNCEAL